MVHAERPEALAKVVAERVQTVNLVLVSGRISQRPYTDGEGQERTNLELSADKVEFLGSSKVAEAPEAGPSGAA